MLKNNKYKIWYYRLIDAAKHREKPNPAERHHIIPKSMGGTETVYLTPREHFICHMLLVKMTSGKNQKRMLWALHRMLYSKASSKRYTPSSKIYEQFRIKFIEMMRKPKSPDHRRKLAKHLTKINKDPDIIERKRQSRLGRKMSPAQRLNISNGTIKGMSNPKVINRMKRSSKKRWSNPNERQKIADKNSKTFKLTSKKTGESIIVKNLAQYCRENNTHHRKVHLEFHVTKLKT